MAAEFNQIDLPPDTLIFNQGDEGDSAYIIEEGRVLIYLVNDGREVPLVVLGEGEIFGEMSLIDLQRRSASARTINECRLSAVNKSQLFERIFSADPVVTLVMGVLVSRIRQQNNMFLDHLISGSTTNNISLGGETKALVFGGRALDDSVRQAHIEGLDQIRLENDLYNAFHNNEFELFYQPIVNLYSGQIVGAEALLRWNSRKLGYVPPSDFIDFIETSSIVVPLGKWILSQCFETYRQLPLDQHEGPFQLSVNVSGKQFLSPHFLEDLEDLKNTLAIDPGNFKLEVTERVMMNGVLAQGILQRCGDLGFHLAIDDFGTGFSSLQFLSQMPMHSLKIDRSFTQQITVDPKVASVVRALISVANELDLSITAEGIETIQEKTMLMQMGVDVGQGYLYSRPLSLVAFCEFLKQKRIAV